MCDDLLYTQMQIKWMMSLLFLFMDCMETLGEERNKKKVSIHSQFTYSPTSISCIGQHRSSSASAAAQQDLRFLILLQ